MKSTRQYVKLGGALLALVLAGVLLFFEARKPGQPLAAGATRAAQQYLGAFCAKDWPGAYAALDADSRAHDSAGQYTQWVTDYRRRLGFEVEAAPISSCREMGDKAVLQAMFIGHAGTRKYKKLVTLWLQRHDGHWGVVLPAAAGVETAAAP